MYLVTGVIRCLVLDRPPVLTEREETIDHNRETGPGTGQVRKGQEDGHPTSILGGVILFVRVRNVASNRDNGLSFKLSREFEKNLFLLEFVL